MVSALLRRFIGDLVGCVTLPARGECGGGNERAVRGRAGGYGRGSWVGSGRVTGGVLAIGVGSGGGLGACLVGGVVV